MTEDEKTTLRLVAAYRAAIAAVETASAERSSKHEVLPGRRGDPNSRDARDRVAKCNEELDVAFHLAVDAANRAWRELQQHARSHPRLPA
jgi:hypothetical protein